MTLIDQALGFHADALALRARRSEVIASNLANSDTPGYRAQDVDFAKTLRALEQSQARSGGLERTHEAHLSGGARGRSDAELHMLFRQPLQPSADGNTVEAHVEKAAFLDNTAGYEASLRFLDARISGLRTALRSESQ